MGNRVARWLQRIGIFFLIVIGILVVGVALLPRGADDVIPYQETWNVDRPLVTADTYVVVTGTPWATAAAERILAKGGNAFDAAAAALLMLNVTYGEAASFPGVAPLVLYDAESQTVHSYIGVGTAPRAATIEFFRGKGYETMPENSILSQLLPASPDVIVALLQEYGTMSFNEVSADAIATAREGFAVHASMKDNLDFSLLERFGFTILLPYNSQVYIKGQWWDGLYLGERATRPELADSLAAMAQAEQAAVAKGATREAGLQAVRDYFYKGPIADAIVAFHAESGGLFTHEDLATYTGGWEEPTIGQVGDYTFYTNGPWNQGIVVIETLKILEGLDLVAIGHNSPAYIHTVSQALELAMADRDAYVGDPAFVAVPLDTLTDSEYAAQRRTQLTDNQAFPALPAPGLIEGVTASPPAPETANVGEGESIKVGQDTSHLAIIDAQGNAITMTPSDFPQTPMVPGTGLTLGNRMIQFRLDPNHVNHMEPGRRPRITPHSVIVFRDDEFWMAYGTPGGDVQPQALVQVFLNMSLFGMDAQEAINAPRFRTMGYEDSFAPHDSYPHTLQLESGVYATAGAALEGMGYTVESLADWHPSAFGAVGIVLQENSRLYAGSDPRENTWAVGN
jgi:gamma-glutamyltranspeptidase/glutathione hydrolase